MVKVKSAIKGKRFTNMLDIPAPAAPTSAVVVLEAPVRFNPAPDLSLVSRGDKQTFIPTLADKYPLAISKGGSATGRLMNIGAYCLSTLGAAFTQSQAEAMKDKNADGTAQPGKSWAVISKDEKKALSDKYDALRQQYYVDAKAVALAINGRADVQVTSFKTTRTGKGIQFATIALLPTVKTSVESVLRTENETLKARLAALEAMVPRKVATSARKKADKVAHEAAPIDVAATAEQQPVAAPVS